MRIAHVSDCFAPRTGGIETQVRDLALAQVAAGDGVRIVTATPGHGGHRSGPDAVAGLEVTRIAIGLPAELPVHPRARREIRSSLARERPDVVHVHVGVVSPFAWSGIAAAGDLGIPTVITVHGVWGPLARRAFVPARSWVASGAVLTAVSPVAADSVRAALGGHADIAIVPNGIDTQVWSAVPRERVPGRLRIVSVLRLAPRKRAGALIDATIRAIRALEPEVQATAVVIGDGPETTRLRRRIARAGLGDRIHLAGRLDPAGIRAVFAESDVFAQASIRESFGLAALEARASGLPVVARVQSGTSAFIHDGVEGMLVADDRGLAEALVRLGRDPALLDALARHCRTAPVREAWPAVLAAVSDCYARAARAGDLG